MRWLDEHEPTAEGVRASEFEVETGDRTVSGVLWRPAVIEANAPLVLFGHGASGDRHQAPIPYLARSLARDEGVIGLAIDGPVHGRRKRGVGGREEMAAEWARTGSVADMVADWQAALDAIQALPDVGTGPVGYWGLSMGTIYGAPLVADEPRIGAAVLGLMGIAGPTSYRSIIADAAARITCPVLFISQLDDELFTREQSMQLFDALASTDKRFHANPGLHPEVPAEEMRHSKDFLVTHLRGRAGRRSGVFPGAGPATAPDL